MYKARDSQAGDCIECCKLVEHSFGVPDGVWSFQDSRELVSLVSLSLLVKVVMPPGAWASSVSAVSIKNCGAASTENVKLAPFEMVISIGCKFCIPNKRR